MDGNYSSLKKTLFPMNYRLDWKALPLQQKSSGAFALSLHPTWWIGRHAICLKMALTMCMLIGDYHSDRCMKRVPVQKRLSRTIFTRFNWLFSDMRVTAIRAYFFQVHWHLQPRVLEFKNSDWTMDGNEAENLFERPAHMDIGFLSVISWHSNPNE